MSANFTKLIAWLKFVLSFSRALFLPRIARHPLSKVLTRRLVEPINESVLSGQVWWVSRGVMRLLSRVES